MSAAAAAAVASSKPLAFLSSLFPQQSFLSGPPPPLPFGPHEDTVLDLPPPPPLTQPLVKQEFVDAAIDKITTQSTTAAAARHTTIMLPPLHSKPFVKQQHGVSDHIARVTVESVSRRTTPYTKKENKQKKPKVCPRCRQSSPGLVLTLNQIGILRQLCPSCTYWSDDEYCLVHEQKYIRNETEGQYECPVEDCKAVGKRFTVTRTVGDPDAPMTPQQLAEVLKLQIKPKCKHCGSKALIEHIAEGNVSCADCSLVNTDVLIVEEEEDGAQDREFEEDNQRERERTARHIRSLRIHDQTVTETERVLRRTSLLIKDKSETLTDRLCTDITKTWLGSTSDAPLNTSVIQEAAKLLVLFAKETKEKLPRCSRSAVQHAAAIFVVTQNQPLLSRTFTGLVLCDQFLAHLRTSKGKPVSITVRTSYFTRFVNRIYDMKTLPPAYKPPTGASGRMLCQFWSWAQSVLRQAAQDERYPLTHYDVDRMNTLFVDMMTNKRAMAETHQFRTVAAVIYCKATEGTEKQVDGKRVRMTMSLAATILQVSKATLSDVKPIFFPSAADAAAAAKQTSRMCSS